MVPTEMSARTTKRTRVGRWLSTPEFVGVPGLFAVFMMEFSIKA
jgi:hypothetical protein